jgi:hypothetical protein
MDLIKLITEKVKNIESSGKLDSIIEEHTLSCINGIVRDSFSWNGEAKKSIEDGLKGKLSINFDKIGISRYHKLVQDIVEEKINSSINQDLSKEISTILEKSIGLLEKKEWKLSDIISKFINGIDKSDMSSEYGEITLHVNDNGKYCHVKFDEEPNIEKYRCKYSLFIYKNELSSAEIDKKPFHPKDMSFKGSFGDFLFKLYCNKVKIEIDDCETEYSIDSNCY